MEGVILGVVLAATGTVAVAAFIVWVRHAAPTFEDVSITVATGESPEQIIDRIAVAVQDLEAYTTSRTDEELLISQSYGPFAQEPSEGIAGTVADTLRVTASTLDVGTRVDVTGRSEPHVVHRVLSAIARSPPWMTARPR